MTVLEIKSEIKRTVDELPESSLAELLDLLKDLTTISVGRYSFSLSDKTNNS